MASPAAATVLAVEDDPIVRADIRFMLEDAGFLVWPARDGEEAITLARSYQPDVILMDLGLPRLDGVEATARILEERSVPIVALSGCGNRDGLTRATEAGAVAHIGKPFSQGHLVGTVSRVLADREREHAHLRGMIESMLRQGHSEREIVAAVEQASGRTRAPSARSDRPLRVLDWMRRSGSNQRAG